MKKIGTVEYKKRLVEMLEYLDTICRNNNINYSLYAGSLIGCVREGGIIPWDDDIDVFIPREKIDYLTKIVNNDNSDYMIMSYDNNKSYYYPFPKLIDKRTIVKETNLGTIDNYGIFIDLFQYNNIPNNIILKNIHYYKIKFYEQLINGYALKESKTILKKARNCFAKTIGLKNIMKRYYKVANKYNHKKTKYVISNWPVYKKYKEIQEASNIIAFIDSKFESINAMIFKEYDKLLSTTFGDYMTPPPIDKRNPPHNITAYYK